MRIYVWYQNKNQVCTGSPRFTIAMRSLKPYRKPKYRIPNPFLHVLERDAFQHIAKVTLSGSDTYIRTYKLNKENKEKNIIMQSLRN